MSAGHGNVPPWVAKAVVAGAPSDDLSVDIAIHLAVKNPDQLKSLVAEVSNPRGSSYGKYLGAAEFAKRFAPSAADVASVQKLMAGAGMRAITVGPNGMYVAAKATVRQLRSTFNVGQTLYSYKGKLLRANDGEPVFPTALADKILFVEGLSDIAPLRTPAHRSATAGTSVAPRVLTFNWPVSTVTPPPVSANPTSPYCNQYFGQQVATLSTAAGPYGKEIPWLVCGYTPQQVRAAYGLDKVNYDGTGITIGIVDAYASPTLQADANRYAANHGLPPLTNKNFGQILPLGVYNVPAADVTNAYDWWTEQSLDIAAVHGAAPGANIVYIGSIDSDVSLDNALLYAIYTHAADVLTNSWSLNGEDISNAMAANYNQAFMYGAAVGMTILFCSGDRGDQAANNGYASGSWPATSSYVTGVGGTSLALTQANGAKSEYGWGSYADPLNAATVDSVSHVTTTGLATSTASGYTFDAFGFVFGSGGGISILENQPAWQSGVVPLSVATNVNFSNGNIVSFSPPARVSPDVAMLADPFTGYVIGETFTIAGNPVFNSGCTPFSATEEYCEFSYGGTSLATPLMAGVIAIMNQKRVQTNRPLVGFANPLFYSHGSGATLTSSGFNQISAPPQPVSVVQGNVGGDPKNVRVVTVNSVPFLFTSTPHPIVACGYTICEGVDDVFNYSSNAADYWTGTTTPAGYNDVTGLGVPYMPKLIDY